MEKDQIQSFLTQNGRFLPQREITKLSYKLQLIEDEVTEYKVLSVNLKNPTLFTLLYWLCPGFAAIDRFFTGQYLSGIFKFIYPILWLVVMYYIAATETGDNLLRKDFRITDSITIAQVLFFGSIAFYLIWIFADGLTMNARTKSYNLRRLLRHL